MIKKLRVVFQFAFFSYSLLIFFKFFKARWPVEVYNAFHIFPFLSAMQANAHSLLWIVAAFIAVLPFFAGRLYCSYMCPLGFIQDVFFKLSGWLKIKKSAPVKYSYLRIFIMFSCVFAAAFSVSSIWCWFDHFSSFGRMVIGFVKPLIFLALRPFASYLNAGGYLQMEETDTTPDFDFIYALCFTLLIIVSAMLRPRWFCATLCPSGAFYSLLFKNGFLGIKKLPNCTSCKKCEKSCPAACIDKGNIDMDRCVTCFECVGECPFGSLKIEYSGPFKKAHDVPGGNEVPAAPVDSSRRRMIKGFSAACAGLFVSGVSRKIGPALGEIRTNTVMPPGALSASNFFSKCSACHLCVSVCPTKVITPSGLENGFIGLSKPKLDFRRGFCSTECAACSEVCPTGALTCQNLDVKKTLALGRVMLDSGPKTECVAYSKKQDCGACAEVCPTGAVYMKYENGVRVPKIWRKFCTGCGMCENACPISGSGKPIFVSPLSKQVVTRPMNEEERARTLKNSNHEGGSGSTGPAAGNSVDKKSKNGDFPF